jgi:hypothetical protein
MVAKGAVKTGMDAGFEASGARIHRLITAQADGTSVILNRPHLAGPRNRRVWSDAVI